MTSLRLKKGARERAGGKPAGARRATPLLSSPRMAAHLIASAARRALLPRRLAHLAIATRASMAGTNRIVFLGGGNSAGYFASQLAADGALEPGSVTIVTDEQVCGRRRGERRALAAPDCGPSARGAPPRPRPPASHGARRSMWSNMRVGFGSTAAPRPSQTVSYERPALSKAYLAPTNPARLPGFHACVGGGGERQTGDWYEGKGVEYRLGARATAVDAAAKTVTLASGDTLLYDTLVVATGARPLNLASDFKVPGADAAGILYLRSVADADALHAALAAAAASKSPVVIVGGGYIGLEVAAAAVGWGLTPTLVFPEDRVLARQLTPAAAAFYEEYYVAKGCTLVKGATAVGFEAGSDGRVAAVTLSDGRSLPAPLVVVGAGARPNTDLLHGQVDLVDGPPGGVKVDASLRSSDPSILAVGDIAAFPGPGGALERHEHVQNARESARHAARVVAGTDKGAGYTYLPYFYSRVFADALAWVMYGRQEGTAVDWGVRDGKAAASGGGKAVFGTYWVDADNRVVGAFLEGGSPDDVAAVKAVAVAAPTAPADLAGQGLAFARGVAAKL